MVAETAEFYACEVDVAPLGRVGCSGGAILGVSVMRIIITAAGLQGVWMAVVGRRRARLWKCREMNAFRKVQIALVVGVLAVVVVACGSDDAGVATVAREIEPTATSVSPPLDTPTPEPEVPTATSAPEPTEAPAATEAPVAEVAPERDLDIVTLLPFDGDPRKPVYARSGWEIPQLEWSEVIAHGRWQSEFFVRNRTDSLLRAMERKDKKVIGIRSISDHMYNCVGMIFASRRAWIETKHLYELLRQDGYNRVSVREIVPGDLVIYTNNEVPTHVGLIMTIVREGSNLANLTILSKWGKEAEIFHSVDVVPELYGIPTEFWSERVRDVIG